MSDPDLLATQRTAILDCIVAAGIDATKATVIAERVEDIVRLAHGGTTCYLPAPNKAERNRKIREHYRRGLGLASLATLYALSEARVRQIVADKMI
ncbi:Mor transcription activator family protein [Thiocystis violacea]|uniref:Mor transcription activator family protein n=1 Tax=Thiocystis violacea TaxID=13725 RepID=UPI001906D535|nr:Mor transcription activator family protein [Thiocystis violacea]MBK1719206.1 hypothetical protein [Thiocystis violacea]